MTGIEKGPPAPSGQGVPGAARGARPLRAAGAPGAGSRRALRSLPPAPGAAGPARPRRVPGASALPPGRKPRPAAGAERARETGGENGR